MNPGSRLLWGILGHSVGETMIGSQCKFISFMNALISSLDFIEGKPLPNISLEMNGTMAQRHDQGCPPPRGCFNASIIDITWVSRYTGGKCKLSVPFSLEKVKVHGF
jgi:hypothetical protein